MSKTSMEFWLIHGAWHDESCWQLLTPLLSAAGHTCRTPRLPIDDPNKQLSDYADVVLEQGRASSNPIVVGHSMSSDVAAIVASRVASAHVVYLCPRMAIFDRPEGEPQMFRDGAFDRMKEDSQERSYWYQADAVECMYPRLEPELAVQIAARLRPQASARLVAPPIINAPKVRSTLIYTTEDEIFLPEWSVWAARNIVGVESIAMPGGHFPMLERPEELARLLLGLAG
jgi:pimeloyl-ACP methyl ester carboxylesterase